MEANGNMWNTLETTVSYKAWARLTPTLTHIVTYELVTSGAEDDAMSPLLSSLSHSFLSSLPFVGNLASRHVVRAVTSKQLLSVGQLC